MIVTASVFALSVVIGQLPPKIIPGADFIKVADSSGLRVSAPWLVSNREVRFFDWSQDARRLYYVTAPAANAEQVSLFVHDLATQTSRELAKLPGGQFAFQLAEVGGQVFVRADSSVRDVPSRLLSIASSGAVSVVSEGQYTEFVSGDEGSLFIVTVSDLGKPTAATRVVWYDARAGIRERWSLSGQWIPAMPMAGPDGLIVYQLDQTESPPRFVYQELGPGGASMVTRDQARTKLEAVQRRVRFYAGPISGKVVTQLGDVAREDLGLFSAQSDSKQPGLETVPLGVLAIGATSGSLAPGDKFVAYLQSGYLFARALQTVTGAELLALEAEAARQKAVEQAKSAALALLLFAADTDDTFPGNSTGWQEKVFPYVKDRSVLASFVYTLKTSDTMKIERPGETELGYILTPHGKAVAMADGSVRWVPKG